MDGIEDGCELGRDEGRADGCIESEGLAEGED
jgi:hypothetical protein